MKFASSLIVAAAAASAVIAAPRPDEPKDGGHGIPPPATIPSTSTSATTSAADAGETKAPEKAAKQPDIQIPFSTTNALFKMEPADAGTWEIKDAPGVFNVSAHFAVKNQDKATATFLPPQAFAGLEVWMYQRPDAGLVFMTLDDSKEPIRIDYFNKTATDKDAPVKVYENKHLKRAHHTVKFANVMDPRGKKFGQFNLDHVVITAAADEERPEASASTSTDASATSDPAQPSDPTTSPPPAAAPEESKAPGGAAFGIGAPKALLSVVSLVAAAFALL